MKLAHKLRGSSRPHRLPIPTLILPTRTVPLQAAVQAAPSVTRKRNDERAGPTRSEKG